jgi:hypothetical protein
MWPHGREGPDSNPARDQTPGRSEVGSRYLRRADDSLGEETEQF